MRVCVRVGAKEIYTPVFVTPVILCRSECLFLSTRKKEILCAVCVKDGREKECV